MATKAQKRAAGEAKAKRETEERKRSGLAAQRIGSSGTLNEQPPLNMSDYSAEADTSGFEVTVGDFRDKMDRLMPLFLVAPGETEAPIRKLLNGRSEH